MLYHIFNLFSKIKLAQIEQISYKESDDLAEILDVPTLEMILDRMDLIFPINNFDSFGVDCENNECHYTTSQSENTNESILLDFYNENCSTEILEPLSSQDFLICEFNDATRKNTESYLPLPFYQENLSGNNYFHSSAYPSHFFEKREFNQVVLDIGNNIPCGEFPILSQSFEHEISTNEIFQDKNNFMCEKLVYLPRREEPSFSNIETSKTFEISDDLENIVFTPQEIIELQSIQHVISAKENISEIINENYRQNYNEMDQNNEEVYKKIQIHNEEDILTHNSIAASCTQLQSTNIENSANNLKNKTTDVFLLNLPKTGDLSTSVRIDSHIQNENSTILNTQQIYQTTLNDKYHLSANSPQTKRRKTLDMDDSCEIVCENIITNSSYNEVLKTQVGPIDVDESSKSDNDIEVIEVHNSINYDSKNPYIKGFGVFLMENCYKSKTLCVSENLDKLFRISDETRRKDILNLQYNFQIILKEIKNNINNNCLEKFKTSTLSTKIIYPMKKTGLHLCFLKTFYSDDWVIDDLYSYFFMIDNLVLTKIFPIDLYTIIRISFLQKSNGHKSSLVNQIKTLTHQFDVLQGFSFIKKKIVQNYFQSTRKYETLDSKNKVEIEKSFKNIFLNIHEYQNKRLDNKLGYSEFYEINRLVTESKNPYLVFYKDYLSNHNIGVIINMLYTLRMGWRLIFNNFLKKIDVKITSDSSVFQAVLILSVRQIKANVFSVREFMKNLLTENENNQKTHTIIKSRLSKLFQPSNIIKNGPIKNECWREMEEKNQIEYLLSCFLEKLRNKRPLIFENIDKNINSMFYRIFCADTIIEFYQKISANEMLVDFKKDNFTRVFAMFLLKGSLKNEKWHKSLFWGPDFDYMNTALQKGQIFLYCED